MLSLLPPPIYPLLPIEKAKDLLRIFAMEGRLAFEDHVSAKGSYSHKSFKYELLFSQVPIYALLPITKTTAFFLGTGMGIIFCPHLLFEGLYSHISFLYASPSYPNPMYPVVPIENPVAPYLAVPPKSVFCVQAFVAGSYSQKSLR